MLINFRHFIYLCNKYYKLLCLRKCNWNQNNYKNYENVV